MNKTPTPVMSDSEAIDVSCAALRTVVNNLTGSKPQLLLFVGNEVFSTRFYKTPKSALTGLSRMIVRLVTSSPGLSKEQRRALKRRLSSSAKLRQQIVERALDQEWLTVAPIKRPSRTPVQNTVAAVGS